MESTYSHYSLKSVLINTTSIFIFSLPQYLINCELNGCNMQICTATFKCIRTRLDRKISFAQYFIPKSHRASLLPDVTNGIIQSIVDSYNYVTDVKGDPRTDSYFLVRSPVPVLILLGTYVYFSVKAGPRFMKNKEPFKLKYVLILYNIIQVLYSIFLFHEGLAGGWLHDYKFSCQPVDYSMNPTAIRMANAVWWFYMAKLTELLDTVFFVLRKKNNQISFLHIYHHFMMPICGWIGVKFLPGGHGTLLGVINAFIHIWMYTYYLISSLGPQYNKHLWWKKHLTEMQMIQFCIIFIHEFQLLFRQCNYPKPITVLLATQAAFFLYLFGKFYLKTYTSLLKKSVMENNNLANGKLKHH